MPVNWDWSISNVCMLKIDSYISFVESSSCPELVFALSLFTILRNSNWLAGSTYKLPILGFVREPSGLCIVSGTFSLVSWQFLWNKN